MANENWKPDLNQPVPNGPIKTYPWLTTLTPDNQIGYEKLYPTSTPSQLGYNLEYAIQTGTAPGVVTLRVVDDQGNVRQFSSFQQLADSGYNFGFPINEENINKLKSRLSSVVANSDALIRSGSQAPSPYYTGTIPPLNGGTQPPPTSPAGQPAGTPNSDPTSTEDNPFANVDPLSLDSLNDQLKDFGDKNSEENWRGITKFLKYPSTIDKGQDRILIQQIEYVTSGITGASDIESVINSLGNRESQFASQFAKSKSKGYVVLPIPNELSETNTTGWGESSLSSIAAAFMQNAAGLAQGAASGNLQKTFSEAVKMGTTGLSPQVEQRLMQYLTANAGASIIKLGGINIDPEAYISRVTGTAINPNLELLFNGPKLRQFGFSFKMTPRSAEEAKNIRSIVKFFKKGMAPRRSTIAAKSIYLGTPNVFRIKFMSAGEIGGIGKIKTCALVSCTVNYTPDGFYAAYEDDAAGSQPIATVLSLAFTELTPIYNDDYDAENQGASNSIGPEINKDYTVKASTTPAPSYSLGARQGPTPGGRTLDVNQAIQQTLIEAAGPLPGGG